MEEYDQYLDHEQGRYQASAETAESHANETSKLLSTLLNAIAAALIGLSAASISNDALLLHLSKNCAGIIITSWALLGASLLLGIAQIILDYFFFVDWRQHATNLTKKISSREINSPEALDAEVQKIWAVKQDSSNQYALWSQIFTLSIGIILLLTAIGITLMKAAH